MIIYWIDEDGDRSEPLNISSDIERELGFLVVLESDIQIDSDTSFEGVCESMTWFINNTFPKEHESYELLKSLIDSKEQDNIIIAWTIINNIDDEKDKLD